MYRRGGDSAIQGMNDGSLPVIIYPTSLQFYVDDVSSHQQIMTLYNPYDFPFKFKVLSTSREKYRVVDSEGSVNSHCSIEIIFKHKSVSHSNERIEDKFRIQMMECVSKKIIGKKDLVSVVLPTCLDKNRPTPANFDDEFKTLPNISNTQQMAYPLNQQQIQSLPNNNRLLNPSPSGWLMVLCALFCGSVLMLPLDSQSKTSIVPAYLHVTPHQKCIAAYILGLITMRLMQS